MINLRKNYLTSINTIFDMVKKNLSYTLVKYYGFSFAPHFIDRIIERKVTVKEFHEMIQNLCEFNRHKFLSEGELVVQYKNVKYICQIYHDVMGFSRRIVFVTAFECNKKYTRQNFVSI